MKADACSKNSNASRNQEEQWKRFLRRFDGVGCDDIIIIVAAPKKVDWIQVRVSSNCVRRRPKKKGK